MSGIIYRFPFDRLNLTNVDEPSFIIDSLDSYTSFGDDSVKAIVYAVNQKGRSQGVLVKEFFLDSGADNRAGKAHESTHFWNFAIGFRNQICSPVFKSLTDAFFFPAVTNSAIDLSPVLLGVLFTLLLLCCVIFAKVYCFRALTTTSGNYSQSEEKHANNISYNKDEVSGLLTPRAFTRCSMKHYSRTKRVQAAFITAQ